MMNKYFLIGVLLLVLSSTCVHAQKVVADKILAIVGDKVILKSEIQNELADIQRRGDQVPPNANCTILEQALIMKALVMQAEKDSLTVNDDELEASLENQVRGFIQQFGSKEAVEQVAGRTIY